MSSLAANHPSLGPLGSRTSSPGDNGRINEPAHSLSGLLSLPNELLQAIAAYLIPDIPDTTRFTLRPNGGWGKKDAYDQWWEWKESHQHLQSLIETCRRLAAVAGPYRYHSIVIHSGRSVVRLFRQLVDCPEAKKWIYNLSCVANLLDEAVVDDARQEWALQMRRGFQLPSDLFVRPIAPRPVHPAFARPSSTEQGIALTLFNRIVGYADNLDDFLLAYPDDSGATMDESLEELLWFPPMRPGTKVVENTTPTMDPSLFPTTTALQRLSSLRLYCHLQGNLQTFRDHTYTQKFASHVIVQLPALTGLRTLEICCDAPGTWSPLFSADFPQLPSIEDVKLYGSRIHEPELVALCRRLPRLRTLVVHFEESADDELDRWRLPGGKTLDQTLLERVGSLQHLELVTLVEDGHYLTRGDERPRKRENHRLTCFPKLYNLRHLTVDFRGLFGTLGIFDQDDGERLRHLLPHSLRSFTLVCEWGTERDHMPVYLANLEMIFHGIRLLCSSRTPKLDSICLAMHEWPLDKTCKYRTKFRKSLEDVRRRCRKAGIQFSTQDLLPAYRDEDEATLEGGEEGGDLEEDDEQDEDEDEDDGQEENVQDEEGAETEEELEEDSEYYFSGDGGDDFEDLERAARKPASFEAFLEQLGPNHGHDEDELFFAYAEDRWDEYLF